MLMRCSEKKDLSEWNNWWSSERISSDPLEYPLKYTPIELEGADFIGAHLEWASLESANLKNANFAEADLSRACLKDAHLEKAYFELTDLRSTHADGAHLEGAKFIKTSLEFASFKKSYTDGNTTFTDCSFNIYTDFTGVGLDSIRIDPGLKVSLTDNIRRLSWQEWLSKGGRFRKFLKHTFVWPFWYLTDYGSSTIRIVCSFIVLAVIFGLIYFSFEVGEIAGLKGIIHDLGTLRVGDKVIPFSKPHILARSMYFSIVTMTTLGFGDMHAAKTGDVWGILGYLFLSIQVIIGYVMLGALITRFGILFSGVGPAVATSESRESIKKAKMYLSNPALEIEELKKEIESLKKLE
jgi:hypothetical protein